MYIVHHDQKRARLYLEAVGFWDLAEALAFYTDVTAACRQATRLDVPLTILSDLSRYLPQGGPVSDTHERSAAELGQVGKRGYALVAPSAVNRMRVRRLLAGIDHQLFEDKETALGVLGWSADYLRSLPHVPEQPNVIATPAFRTATPNRVAA